LFAFGGLSNRVFAYDPARDAWVDVAPSRFRHGDTPAVGVLDDRIYVAGGTGAGMIGNELESYAPPTNTWATLAPMRVPRNHCAGGFIGGRFYVAGGRPGAIAESALEAYDPRADAWTTLPSMPTSRSGVAAAVVNGRFYVFGGEGARIFGEAELLELLLQRLDLALQLLDLLRHGAAAERVQRLLHALVDLRAELLDGGLTRSEDFLHRTGAFLLRAAQQRGNAAHLLLDVLAE